MLPQWIMIRCSSPQLARILNGTLTLAYGAVPGRASRTDQRSALPGGATRGRRDEPRIRKREDSPRRAGGAGRVRALSHAMREGGSLRGLFRVLAVRAAMTDSACVFGCTCLLTCCLSRRCLSRAQRPSTLCSRRLPRTPPSSPGGASPSPPLCPL